MNNKTFVYRVKSKGLIVINKEYDLWNFGLIEILLHIVPKSLDNCTQAENNMAEKQLTRGRMYIESHTCTIPIA